MKKKVSFDLTRNQVFRYDEGETDDRINNNQQYQDILRNAIKALNYQVFRSIINSYLPLIDLNLPESRTGRTFLHDAVLANLEPWAIELLINNGAEINIRDHAERTALLDAFLYENSNLVLLLLSHGAEISDISNKLLCFYPQMRRVLEIANYLEPIEDTANELCLCQDNSSSSTSNDELFASASFITVVEIRSVDSSENTTHRAAYNQNDANAAEVCVAPESNLDGIELSINTTVNSVQELLVVVGRVDHHYAPFSCCNIS